MGWDGICLEALKNQWQTWHAKQSKKTLLASCGVRGALLASCLSLARSRRIIIIV
jgi:hypothetical protein